MHLLHRKYSCASAKARHAAHALNPWASCWGAAVEMDRDRSDGCDESPFEYHPEEQVIHDRILDKQFYSNGIRKIRMEGSPEAAEGARRVFLRNLLMDQGMILEWIDDIKRTLGTDVMAEDLESVLGACRDMQHIRCWDRLLDLVAGSQSMEFGEKDAIFQEAARQIGRNVAEGHRFWERYLRWLAEAGPAADGSLAKAEANYRAIPFDAGVVGTAAVAGSVEELRESIQPYEQSLKDAGDYGRYIRALLKTQKRSFELVHSVFMRAETAFPAEAGFWIEHINYLRELGEADLAFVTANRARRANPHSGLLWIEYAAEMEKRCGLAEVLTIYSVVLNGIQSDADMALFASFYMDVVGREAGLSELARTEHITAVPRVFGSVAMAAKATKLLARRGHKDGLREMWEDLERHGGCGSQAEFWVERARAEQYLGGLEPSKVFQRGVSLMNGPADRLYDAWLEYEGVHGTAESAQAARHKIFKQKRLVAERTGAKEPAPPKDHIPRKAAKATAEEAVAVELPPAKDKTVFVNNIDFRVSEAQLRDFFESNAGPVAAVKTGRTADGKPRGWATVEFLAAATVEQALKLDRARIHSRPLFVSRYQTVGSREWRSPVSHPTGRDPCTLFLSGLGPDATEAAVAGLFQGHCAGFKTVRLGLKKDGACKGFAYAEFDSPEHAQAALVLSGADLMGHAVAMAVSDPSRAPKVQTMLTSMVPPSVSRHKPRLNLN